MKYKNILKWLALADRLEVVTRTTSALARWAVLMMLSLGLWNVLGRYFGVFIGHNLSSNGLIEGQWYLFDVVFLLGLSWTLQKQGHVRVDVLQAGWRPRRKARMELFGTCFFLLPFAIGVLIISISPALHSWSIRELSPDPDGLPRYLVKTLIPIGFFLLSLQGIAEAIKSYVIFSSSSDAIQSLQEKASEKSFD